MTINKLKPWKHFVYINTQTQKIFRKHTKTLSLSLFTLALITALTITMAGIPNLAPSQKPTIPASSATTDYIQYVNLIQGLGVPNNDERQIFMRYPLGRIGLWSRGPGEIADSVTRGLRLYPMLDQTVAKDNTDWRGSIIANPAQTDITYTPSSPAKGSTVSLTVTPNVSIYKYHFNNPTSFGAVGFTLGNMPDSPVFRGRGTKWTNNTFTIIDDQTAQIALTGGSRAIYYYVKFNTPGTGTSTGGGGYFQFPASTKDVVVAVALSHSSMNQAKTFFTQEFSNFDFPTAVHKLKDAWNAKLGKIDVQSADQLTKQMLYTGLYTVYANIINATDGSAYAAAAAAYGSPILTIGSSIGWEYVGGGYFRAAFDQGRDVYYLLTLIDPTLMTDIAHTYQAQYDRDKVLLGNWDPYSPNSWTDQQWGFWGGMFLRAKLMGVPGIDYVKAKDAIADTLGNPNNILSKSQYLSKGYIPADGGVPNFMSRALEWSTDVHGLALLAKTVGDETTYTRWIPRALNYRNNWDVTTNLFRAKNADSSWGALGNTGFFEGNADRYAFDVIHDGLGLAELYGDSLMTSKIDTLLKLNKDYNDFEPQYQWLPVYSNNPSTGQDITRNRFIPQFNALNMWEAWRKSDVYYTHNACDLIYGILGLFPIQSPGAQWILHNPSVTTAVIHGAKDIIIQANNNSPSNAYVSSIQVNGAAYPSHFISGKTLTAGNTTITFGMTNRPSRIGNMYITGTDGEILAANTDNNTYLQFQNDPIATTSRAKIFSTKEPTSVLVNNAPLAATNWIYDATNQTINIKGLPGGNILICFITGTCQPSNTQPSIPLATDTPL